MDDFIKLVKYGFFLKNISEHIYFYRYDEISHIIPIYFERDFYKITVVFFKREQLILKDKNQEISKEVYNKILNCWINYHSQNPADNIFIGIEKKLDTLLNHIEVMPGGEEYEKSKNNCESKISFGN